MINDIGMEVLDFPIKSKDVALGTILRRLGIVPTASRARNLCTGGYVHIDGCIEYDYNTKFAFGDRLLLSTPRFGPTIIKIKWDMK